MRKQKQNAKCMKCGYVTSLAAIGLHLKSHHSLSQKLGKTYTLTNEKYIGKKGRWSKRRTSNPPPQLNYVDVPVVIRIPLTIGQVQILQAEQE